MKIEQYQKLLKIAETKERLAKQIWLAAQAKQNQSQQRVEQLQSYIGEYHQAYVNHGREGMSGRHLQVEISFMKNLKNALTQQNGHLELCMKQTLQLKNQWLGAQQALERTQTLYEKQKLKLRYQQEKRQQKEIDSLSSERAAWGKNLQ